MSERSHNPGGSALISDPYRRPFEEFGDALEGQGLDVELRPFKECRSAALPVNEEVVEQPGFVQHWGKQKGQLFFVVVAFFCADLGGILRLAAA